LQDECRIVVPREDPIVGNELPPLQYPGSTDSGGSVVKGTLPRLTAEVVRIIVNDDKGRTTVTAGPPEAGLAYKVYRDGEENCADIHDNERTFEDGELTVADIVYVVLANTQHDPGSRIEYTLEIKPASPSPTPLGGRR